MQERKNIISMEFICNVCGAYDGKFIYEQTLPDLNYDANESILYSRKIDYWICNKCGAIAQFPLPSLNDINSYYKTTRPAMSDAKVYDEYKNNVFTDRIDFILETIKIPLCGCDVLEVGCANGNFLNKFSKLGFNCTGIEPSDVTSAIAKNLYGLNIIAGVVESMNLDELKDKFDLVLSMHTLEHVLDPVLFVRCLVSCIKPNGYLYIEVPDNEKVPGDIILSWGDQISAVHVTHFTAQSLIILLASEGLSINHISSTGEYRYPSWRIFGQKLDASKAGYSSFMKVVNYQDDLFRAAGKNIITIISEFPDVVIWGAGSDLHQIMINTPEINKHNLIIVDRNDKKIGKTFLGHQVADPAKIKNIKRVVISPSSRILCDEIERDIKIFFPEAMVYRLF